MPRPPHRPAPHTRILATLSLVLATAVPHAAAAAPWPGDPDVPAAGPHSVLRRDLDRLFSARTLETWAAGGALALAAHQGENPDRAEASLGTGAIDVPADAGNLYGSGVLLGAGALGLYAVGHFTGDENARGAGGEMLRAMAYSTVVVTALKVAVDRTRPNGGGHSFPSGHTTLAFAVAPVLARRFGLRAAIPAYALAVATGMGRMEDRKHYLSDVIMGAAIGLSIGRAVVGPNTNAGPQLALGPGGAGLTVHF